MATYALPGTDSPPMIVRKSAVAMARSITPRGQSHVSSDPELMSKNYGCAKFDAGYDKHWTDEQRGNGIIEISRIGRLHPMGVQDIFPPIEYEGR
jgi:hypothetical protein